MTTPLLDVFLIERGGNRNATPPELNNERLCSKAAFWQHLEVQRQFALIMHAVPRRVDWKDIT